MCGESGTAKALAASLGSAGVLASAIVFPMVSRDGARVRNQLSAGLSDEQLEQVLEAYEAAGKAAHLI